MRKLHEVTKSRQDCSYSSNFLKEKITAVCINISFGEVVIAMDRS